MTNLSLGTGTGGTQQTGLPAAPCNSFQTKVVMGSIMPPEIILEGAKMVGVWNAHLHLHLNPYLCASFLLPPCPAPQKSPVAMWNGGRHRPRMWLGVPSQTMHTGGNGVMVVEIVGWSSTLPRQLLLRLSSSTLLTPEMGKDLEKVVQKMSAPYTLSGIPQPLEHPTMRSKNERKK